MAKFSAALIASLIASSSAFAPQSQTAKSTAIQATGFEEVGGVAFDPLGLAKLGTGESFDTFPGVFPDIQYLQEAEIKHGRQAMIAWTGVWATHQVRREQYIMTRVYILKYIYIYYIYIYVIIQYDMNLILLELDGF